MTWLTAFSRIVNQGIEHLLFLLGFAMAFVVALQVFFRYVLNASLFWSEELARHLLIWLTFLGASAAYYRGKHPGIDTLVNRLPPAWRWRTAVLGHCIALGFFSVMVWYGFRFAWFVRLQETPSLHLPKWLVFGAVPLGGLVLMFHAVTFLIQTLQQRHDR